MAINGDLYYSRSECSNSDLTKLKNYFDPNYFPIDLERAFKFGSLVDAIITELHLVDYFKYQVAGVQYTVEDFQIAMNMQKSFNNDPFARRLLEISETQKVSVKEAFQIVYGGIQFSLPVRCKWDFFAKSINIAADLKSTACTNLKQFMASIEHHDYDRQAAWYMDIEQRDNFMFVGVSKVAPYKVFKVPIKRGERLYNSGKAKYQELAFDYWKLFGDITNYQLLNAA